MKRLHWHELAGYLLILGAACFWGSAASLGKFIFQKGISTIMLMQARSVISSVVVIIALLLFAQKHLKIAWRDLPGLILLAIPGLALVNASYFYAVKLLPIAVAVFIQFTAPIIVYLYGLITHTEKSSPGKFLALVLSIFGTYLMLRPGSGMTAGLPWIGLVSAIVSTFSYAFYVIFSHRLGSRLSSWTMIAYGYGIASIFWCIVQNPAATTRLIVQQGVVLHTILFSVLSTLIPFSLFLIGLRRVTPTGASITSTSETISATLFAFLFLNEHLSLFQVAGGTLILLSIVLLILQRREVKIVQEEPIA